MAQTPYFASLNFNPTGAPLLPIIPPIFINTFRPQLASIVVFDIFIANTDRHARNISADYGKPSFGLFDHSIALFGLSASGSGKAHLAHITNDAGIWNHPVIAGVNDEESLVEAVARVESIPDYSLRAVVSEAANCGTGRLRRATFDDAEGAGGMRLVRGCRSTPPCALRELRWTDTSYFGIQVKRTSNTKHLTAKVQDAINFPPEEIELLR
jgi:hypothetical protein